MRLNVVAVLARMLPAGFILLGHPRLAPANLLILFTTHAALHAGMAWSLFTHAIAITPVPQPDYSSVDAQS